MCGRHLIIGAFASLPLLLGCLTSGGIETGREKATEVARTAEERLEGTAGPEAVQDRSPEQARLPGSDEERFVPVTPEGITAIEVPSYLSEPTARYHPQPLSPEIAAIHPSEIPKPAGPPRPGTRGRGYALQGVPDTVAPEAVTTKVGPAAPPPLSTSFDSTTFIDNSAATGGYLFIPADPIGASGPSHLVNVVNVTIRFYQKSGVQDFSDAIADFFAVLSPLTFTFDPKVVYDQYEGRFVVVALEQTDTGYGDPSNTSRIFVAVSDDSDPNGTWYMAAINANTVIGPYDYWADYPGLAVDDRAIYVTANMFRYSSDGGNYGGVRLWAIEKGVGSGGFYDGVAVIAHLLDPYAGGGTATTTMPAHTFGAIAGGTGAFLISYSGLSSDTGGDGSQPEYVQVVNVAGSLTSPVMNQSYVDVGNIEDFKVNPTLPSAPQSGSSYLIDVVGRRAFHGVWFDDALWMTATINPKPGDPDSGQTTAHWWALDTTNPAAPTLSDQGSVLGDDIASGTYTFFLTVAVNGAGHTGFGFSGSGPSIYPGSFYTDRVAGDPAGSTRGSGTLRSGVASYRRTFSCASVSRWGDYSGIDVDPVDGCFWVYNMSAIAQGNPTTDCTGDHVPDENGQWGTAWGRICPTGACPPDLLVPTGTQYTTTVANAAGGQVLTQGNVTVMAAGDVTYRAGQRIVLGNGFKVETNGTFIAELGPCP